MTKDHPTCGKCGTPVGFHSMPGGRSIAVCAVCDGPAAPPMTSDKEAAEAYAAIHAMNAHHASSVIKDFLAGVRPSPHGGRAMILRIFVAIAILGGIWNEKRIVDLERRVQALEARNGK